MLWAQDSRAVKQRGTSRERTLLAIGSGEENKIHNPGLGREGEDYRGLSMGKSRDPVEGVLRKQAHQVQQRSDLRGHQEGE